MVKITKKSSYLWPHFHDQWRKNILSTRVTKNTNIGKHINYKKTKSKLTLNYHRWNWHQMLLMKQKTCFLSQQCKRDKIKVKNKWKNQQNVKNVCVECKDIDIGCVV